jgi:GNAT superfamily N-acetyltransferase
MPPVAARRSRLPNSLSRHVRDVLAFPATAHAVRVREGWPGVRRLLRERTLHRLWRRGRLLVVEHDLEAPDAAPEGVRIRRLDEADLAALATIATPQRLERMRRALRRGRRGLVAWREARPVGWAWSSDRIEPDLEIHPLPLPPGTVYFWDLYVDPRERNHGVGSALASARAREALERGFHVGWRAIAPDNVPSLHTLERTAAAPPRVVGEIRYLKLFRRMRSRFVPSPAGGRRLPGVTRSPLGKP